MTRLAAKFERTVKRDRATLAQVLKQPDFDPIEIWILTRI